MSLSIFLLVTLLRQCLGQSQLFYAGTIYDLGPASSIATNPFATSNADLKLDALSPAMANAQDSVWWTPPSSNFDAAYSAHTVTLEPSQYANGVNGFKYSNVNFKPLNTNNDFAFRLHFSIESASKLRIGCTGFMRLYNPAGAFVGQCANPTASPLTNNVAEFDVTAGLWSVFYVFRSSGSPGFLLERSVGANFATSQPACSVLNSRHPEPNMFPMKLYQDNNANFADGNIRSEGDADYLSTTGTFKVGSRETSSAAIWHFANSQSGTESFRKNQGKLHLQSGFRSQFKYKVLQNPSNAQGFALVAQRSSQFAIATRAGDSLGYEGITESFAIEFDMANRHVEVHTNWAGANVVNTANRACCATSVTLDPTLWATSRWNEVLVEVVRTSSSQGEVRVWWKTTGAGDLLLNTVASNAAPNFKTTIDWSSWSSTIGDGAWLGFTSSTPEIATSQLASIEFSDWRVWTVPAAAPASTFAYFPNQAGWTRDIARDAASTGASDPHLDITTRDACSQVRVDTIVQPSFGVTGTAIVGSAVQSRNQPTLLDGIFSVRWFHTLAGPTRYGLEILVNGQPTAANGVPYEIDLIPAPIDGPTSQWEICCPAPAGVQTCCNNYQGSSYTGQTVTQISQEWIAGKKKTIRVKTRDRFANDNTDQTDGLYVQFFADASPILKSARAGGLPLYEYYFEASSTKAVTSSSIFIRYSSQGSTSDVSAIPLNGVTVFPGTPASTEKSRDTLIPTPTAAAAETVVYSMNVVDDYNNQFFFNSALGAPRATLLCIEGPCRTAGPNNGPLAPTVTATVNEGANLPVVYDFAWSSNELGRYEMAITINTNFGGGTTLPASSAPSTLILAANSDVTQSVSLPEGSNFVFVAGEQSYIEVQARDRFGNDRVSANDNGIRWAVDLRNAQTTGLQSRADCEVGCNSAANTCAKNSADNQITGVFCYHQGQGIYRIYFSVKQLGSLTMNILQTGGANGDKDFSNIVIEAAGPNCLESSSSVVPTTLVAGTQGTVSVISRDEFGNERDDPNLNGGNGDKDRFFINFRSLTAIFSGDYSAWVRDPTDKAKYNLVFTPTKAATYDAEAKLGNCVIKEAASMNPPSFTVEPAVLDFSKSSYLGAGYTGALSGQEATFRLLPKDQYGNPIPVTQLTVNVAASPSMTNIRVDKGADAFTIVYTAVANSYTLTLTGTDSRAVLGGANTVASYGITVEVLASIKIVWGQVCASVEWWKDTPANCGGAGYSPVARSYTIGDGLALTAASTPEKGNQVSNPVAWTSRAATRAALVFVNCRCPDQQTPTNYCNSNSNNAQCSWDPNYVVPDLQSAAEQLTTCGTTYPPSGAVLASSTDALRLQMVLTKVDEPDAGLQILGESTDAAGAAKYNIAYTAQAAGTYRVVIKGDGFETQQSLAEKYYDGSTVNGLYLQIAPGDAWPPNSDVDIPVLLFAGEQVSVPIELKDFYGNRITEASPKFSGYNPATDVAQTAKPTSSTIQSVDFDYDFQYQFGGGAGIARDEQKVSAFAAPSTSTTSAYYSKTEFLQTVEIGGGNATFTFKPKTSGVSELIVKLRATSNFGPGNAGTVGVYRVVVLAGVANAARSCLVEQPATPFVSCPRQPSIARAGTTFTVKFFPRDNWDNPVVNGAGGDILWRVELSDNDPTELGYSQSFVPGSTADSSYYLLSFTPKIVSEGGRNTLDIYYADTAPYGIAKAGSFSLTVDPGPVSELTSFTEGLETPLKAGQEAHFILNLRDEFNNTWFDDSTTSKLTLSVAVTDNSVLSSGGSSGNRVVSKNDGGRYDVFFTPIRASSFVTPSPGSSPPWFVTVAPNDLDYLRMDLFVDGTPNAVVPQGRNSPRLDRLEVIAGSPLATNTFPLRTNPIDAIRPTLVAGKPFSYTIHLRDQYFNPLRVSAGDVIDFSFFADPICGSSASSSSGDADPALMKDLNFSDSSVLDNQDGSYTILVTGRLSGNYGIDVRVNGAEINPSCTQYVPLKIIPDTIYPPMCQLSGAAITNPNDNLAGLAVSLEVLMKDRFGNDVIVLNEIPTDTTQATPNTAWPTSVVISAYTNIYNPTSDPCGPGVTYLVSSPNTIQLAQVSGRPGVWATEIVETIAKEYKVLVYINIGAVYTQAGYASLDAAGFPVAEDNSPLRCRPLIILPFCIYRWTSTQVQDLVAGTPGELEIEGYDKHDNLVQTSTHRWDATAELGNETYRTASRPDLDIYKVIASSAPPAPNQNHLVRYTLHWEGNYALGLTLRKDPRCESEELDKDMRGTTIEYFSVIPAACKAQGQGNYRCANSGTCVAAASECPAGAEAGCSSGNACEVGAFKWCQVEACPNLINSKPRFPAWATNTCSGTPGALRTSAAECPAKRSCPQSMSLCGDLRTCVFQLIDCVDPAAYVECDASFPVRCEGGTCVKNGVDCPTPVTCTGSNVLCPDGSCQSSATLCPSVYQCFEPFSVRCADGSCRANSADCPSQVTCPPGWLKCPNQHCRRTIAECTAQSCPLEMVRCPDGTCIETFDLCPSLVTCPPEAPVLCSNRACAATVTECTTPPVCGAPLSFACPSGDCASRASDCSTNPSCPSSAPVLCPDNTCHTSVDECFSRARGICSDATPFRCLDGSCRAAFSDCPTLMRCPPYAPVKCASGGCVASSQMCPSKPQDCGEGVACPGGGCAVTFADCPTAITCPPGHVRCGDSSCRENCNVIARADGCPFGLFKCPVHESGNICVLKLEDCPQSPTCPRLAPVRCADRTCRISADLCPPAPQSWDINKVPCAGNTWGAQCNSQSATCPSTYPYKCWDDTCRVLPTDCPPERKCQLEHTDPASVRPYLCPEGNCGAYLTQCNPLKECVTIGDLNKKVKCPFSLASVDSGCVDDADMCPDPFLSDRQGITCKEGRKCYDGSCRKEACPVVRECPHHVGVLCLDGTCRRHETECPSEEDLIKPCEDQELNTEEKTFYRCADGACAEDCGATSFYQVSVSGVAVWTLPMACPYDRPYKCPNGQCVISGAYCALYMNPTCGDDPKFPVTCADGTCAASNEACPVVKACSPELIQCQDGSCVKRADKCPEGERCSGSTPYLCPDNTCSSSAETCIDPFTGCRSGFNKCDDGTCSVGACPTTKAVLSNGCTAAAAEKCYDGSCKAVGGCGDLPVGCSELNIASPACNIACGEGKVKCADGSCANSFDTCKTAQNCPIGTPFRCADGSCKKYPAVVSLRDDEFTSGLAAESCSILPVCPAAYAHLCYDGSCVTNKAHCPAFYGCPAGTISCSQLGLFDQCVDAEAGVCPSPDSPCPPGAATLCPDGSCRVSRRECPPPPGPVCNWPTPFKCFDGSCQASPLVCIERGQLVYSEGAFTVNTVASCADGFDLCWDGTCAPVGSKYCPVLPACPPVAPFRCTDGSCADDGASCNAEAVGKCASGGVRCHDGACRSKASCSAALYNGCSNSDSKKAYYCPRKATTCLANAEQCFGKESAPSQQEACDVNCNREYPALPQVVSASLSHDTYVDVSLRQQRLPAMWMKIPAAAFGYRAKFEIKPVSLSSLDGGYYVLNAKQKYVTHSQIIRSTPFQCEVTPAKGQRLDRFPLNISVWATGDKQKFAEPGEIPLILAPCEWRGKWGMELSQASPPVAQNCKLLSGNVTVGQQDFHMEINNQGGNDCEVVDFKGNQIVIESEDETSACLCYNITTVAKTNTRTDVVKGQRFCLGFVRLGNNKRAMYNTDLDKMGECPSLNLQENIATRRVLTLRSNEFDICQTEGKAGEVRPNDVCLGIKRGQRWDCIQGYYERLDFPTWEPDSGERSYVYQGRLPQCEQGVTYAFVSIPLPAEPEPLSVTESFWERYGKTVLGVSIFFVICMVIMLLLITRLIRYRTKYKREQAEADDLRERAAEYQEKMGGLGMWDDEMEMVTNPLVLKISEEKKKLDAVSKELEQREREDEQTAEQLEKERQQILAEMKRLSDMLNDAREKNTARTDYDVGASTDTGYAPERTSRGTQDLGGDVYGDDPYGDDGGGFDGDAGQVRPKKKNEWA